MLMSRGLLCRSSIAVLVGTVVLSVSTGAGGQAPPAADVVSSSSASPTSSAHPSGIAQKEPAPTAEADLPSTPSLANDSPTSEVLALLKRIEERHGNLKTLQAEFDQVKVSETFADETRSHGSLLLEMPDRLRCEYDRPDPSTILFVDDTLYQFVPTIKQVDKWRFRTKAEAQEQLRLLLLGFGLSSEEILKSYRVERVEAAEPKADRVGESEGEGGAALPTPSAPWVLAFRPRNREVAKHYTEIRVSFDRERLLPRSVRLTEVAGDVTNLTIQPEKVLLNEKIEAGKFKPEFPGNPEVIEHES